MIKFFRNIRRSLLNENKMGKYLKYAIGEILLVVIGILIALQINNWNENRKNKLRQITYLERLKSDLESDIAYCDIEEIRDGKRFMAIDSSLKIYAPNPSKKTFDEIIPKLTESLSELLVNTSTYEEMISTGILFNLKNKSLINDIKDFYKYSEGNIYNVQANNNDIAAEWDREFFDYVTVARYALYQKNTIATNDFSVFYDKNSPHTLALIKYLYRLKGTYYGKVEFVKEQRKYAEELIAKIDDELLTY